MLLLQAWRSDRKQLAGRAGFTAGSFFDAGAIPAATSDRDVFAMRQILHDWSDGDSIRILKQVRAAQHAQQQRRAAAR